MKVKYNKNIFLLGRKIVEFNMKDYIDTDVEEKMNPISNNYKHQPD